MGNFEHKFEFISVDMVQFGGIGKTAVLASEEESLTESFCEPRMSVAEGAVRFLSIVSGSFSLLFFGAMFIDLFFQNIALPFTNGSVLVIAMTATSFAFADLIREFQLVE